MAGKYSKVIRELEEQISALVRQCDRILAEKGQEIARLQAALEDIAKADLAEWYARVGHERAVHTISLIEQQRNR